MWIVCVLRPLVWRSLKFLTMLSSLASRSSASVKWSRSRNKGQKLMGIAQLHCSLFQETTTAKDRGRKTTMKKRRRRGRHEAGRSVTLLQDAWGPHRGGAEFITGITLEMFTVRLNSKRERRCNQLCQLLISLISFLFIHKHNPNHVLPVLEVIAFFLFFF